MALAVRLAAGHMTVVGTAALAGAPVRRPRRPRLPRGHGRALLPSGGNLVDPEAPGAAGFVGGVSFSAPVGGLTSVNLFVSRATTVVCEDGSEDFVTLTLRTPTDEATAPGPVSLDIDRRLLTAEGVDLLEKYSQARGQEPGSTVLPSQTVRTVQGTTVRFRTGIPSRASRGHDSARLRSVDFARDGVGSASIGLTCRTPTARQRC